MITVEWFDFDMPGKDRLRRGKLLQVSPTTRDPVNIAFVITPAMDHDRDRSHHIERGENIILAVKLTQLKVLGVDIPLFDHAP